MARPFKLKSVKWLLNKDVKLKLKYLSFMKNRIKTFFFKDYALKKNHQHEKWCTYLQENVTMIHVPFYPVFMYSIICPDTQISYARHDYLRWLLCVCKFWYFVLYFGLNPVWKATNPTDTQRCFNVHLTTIWTLWTLDGRWNNVVCQMGRV